MCLPLTQQCHFWDAGKSFIGMGKELGTGLLTAGLSVTAKGWAQLGILNYVNTSMQIKTKNI